MNLESTLNAAIMAHRSGQLKQAERGYRDILSRVPEHPQSLHLLATLLLQLDRHQEAGRLIEKAIRLFGPRPELRLNRGLVFLGTDRAQRAAADFEAVVTDQPQNFSAWLNLALARQALGDDSAELAALRTAVELRPDHPQALIELACAALRQGQDGSAELSTELISQAAAFPRQFKELIRLKAQRRQLDGLESLAEKVFAAFAEQEADRVDLLRIVHTTGLLSLSLKLCEQHLASHPECRETRLLRATSFLSLGMIPECLAEYERLLEQHPGFWQAHSNYLIALQHDPATTPEQLIRAHQNWAEQHAPAPEPPGQGQEKPKKSPERLRIGWFTPRLLEGPMVSFFLRVLEALPRDEVEHWLYLTYPARDSYSVRFIEASDRFRDFSAVKDEDFVQQVRADSLDLAVDLSGHGPHHSLKHFAKRLAPVQCSWLDYFHPTGIPAIDYFLSDRVISDGPGLEAERLVDLERGRLCFSPVAEQIALDPDSSSKIRFGCFNRLAKLNDELLQTWKPLFERFPGAELELRSLYFHDPESTGIFLSRARRAGLPTERIQTLPWESWVQMLQAYRNIDLALDPFPFSGCATSADALWMGVPVVTLKGSSMVARQTASLLSHAGFKQWIASTADEYVDIAASIVTQGTREGSQRQQIRQQFMAAQGDHVSFAAELEARLIELITQNRRH